MPKREDEYWASSKESLEWCHVHKRLFRHGSGGCQTCLYEAIALRQELHAFPKASLKLEECPTCHKMSRFWNSVIGSYDCANCDCA